MHYLLTVIGDTTNEVDDSEPGAVDAFNQKLKADGRWVFGGGLTSPDDATVTDNRGSSPVHTDGPFVGIGLVGGSLAESVRGHTMA